MRSMFRRNRPCWAPAALLAATLIACGGGEKKAQVTFYYLPSIPESAARLAEVRALEQEFAGQVTVRAVDASTDAARRDLARFEIGASGIVIRDSRGVLVEKMGGYKFKLDAVRMAVRKASG